MRPLTVRSESTVTLESVPKEFVISVDSLTSVVSKPSRHLFVTCPSPHRQSLDSREDGDVHVRSQCLQS